MKRSMRRRGSHSANMLKPAIAVVQGQQQQQDPSDDGVVRRTSAPSFVGQGATNGGIGAMQAPPPQAPAWQANDGAPAQTNGSSMQWQHTPSFGQSTSTTSTRHHSFSSSMDLMTTAAPAHAAASAASAFQSHMFQSSSHRTSHTAAAGDLLTMSRRALDPPSPNQGGAKKRSSAVFNGNDGNVGQVGGTNSTPPGGAQPPAHNIFTHPQQQQPLPPPLIAPQNGKPMYQSVGGVAQFNGQMDPAFQTFVSSSTIGSENDDLHQQQRRIRQCRRSNSFEMMDDC